MVRDGLNVKMLKCFAKYFRIYSTFCAEFSYIASSEYCQLEYQKILQSDV